MFFAFGFLTRNPLIARQTSSVSNSVPVNLVRYSLGCNNPSIMPDPLVGFCWFIINVDRKGSGNKRNWKLKPRPCLINSSLTELRVSCENCQAGAHCCFEWLRTRQHASFEVIISSGVLIARPQFRTIRTKQNNPLVHVPSRITEVSYTNTLACKRLFRSFWVLVTRLNPEEIIHSIKK